MKDGLAADLLIALSRTVLDVDHWDKALCALCEYCGASKALISRRAKKTAEIIIPTAVENEWQSPLIHGFSSREVETFLTQFAATDPWTQIEAQHFPYTPYALGTFLPLSQLKETPFWTWLAPQGLVESVVAVVDQDETGWTALNLYLTQEQAAKTDLVIQKLTEVLPDLRGVWCAGRDVFVARSDYRPVSSIVEHMSDPCIVIDLQAIVSDVNAAASELSQTGVLKAVPGKALAFPKQWARYLPSNLTGLAHLTVLDGADRWQPIVDKGIKRELPSGERKGYRLVFIVQKRKSSSQIPDWESPLLNEREKMLVKHLARGGRVKDGADLFGVSVRANANIWKSASDKLGGLKKQDLVLRNRDVLKNEEK